MRRQPWIVALALLLNAGCGAPSESNNTNQDLLAPSALVAAVGIEIGDGPHKGQVQAFKGTRVEISPLPSGEIRAFVMDESGKPLKASGQVTASVSAPEFATAEVTLNASADGAFFIGKLPGPPPSKPAQVAVTFPEQQVTFVYPQVALVVEAAPLIQIDAVPPRFDSAGAFVPPHQGSVQTVGDNYVEVVVAPSGDVQVYAYDPQGVEIPPAEIQLSEVEVVIDDAPQVVVLQPAPVGFYFSGRFEAKVKSKAKVKVAFTKPVIIREAQVAVAAFPTVEVRSLGVVYRHDNGNHYGQIKNGKGYPAGNPKGGVGVAVPGVNVEVKEPGFGGAKGSVGVEVKGGVGVGVSVPGVKVDVKEGGYGSAKGGVNVGVGGFGGAKGSVEVKEPGFGGAKGSSDPKAGYGTAKDPKDGYKSNSKDKKSGDKKKY